MSPDFARRSDQPELMDQPCDFDTFRDCLEDLASVNRLTLAHRPTFDFLERLRREERLSQPVTIVDVGSGYGDLLRKIARWSSRRRLSVRLTGLDLSPWSARAAAALPSSRPIAWATANVFDYRGAADVVVSSLFTHHLSDAEIIAFLRWMEEVATVGWFVNDLHRHPFPYYGFGLLARVMRWHRFVQHDGPVSIARAFTASDWRGYIAAAGLPEDQVELRWRFPFRLCVGRVRRR
jgi:SAM-dependent methyltransferase